MNMANYKIVNHRLEIDGKAVDFKQTPNVSSGTLNPIGLIYHDTASGLSSKGPISWLLDKRAKASAHVVIARDGTITQLARFNQKAWHAGKSSYKINGKMRHGLNSYCIGAEIVNPGGLKKVGNLYQSWFGSKYADGYVGTIEYKRSSNHAGYNYWMTYTPEQIRACTSLGLALKDKYGFDFIGTHWMISPGRKIDPNPLFPLEKIMEQLSGRAETSGISLSERLKAAVRGEPSDKGVSYVVDTTRGLNLRRYPSMRSRIIKAMTKGTGLAVIRKGNITGKKWWKVSTGPNTGWVDSSYLMEL